MINVVVPGILAFIVTLFAWIAEGTFGNPNLKNKVGWFLLTWIVLTFILGMTGLFFIPLF